MDYQLWIEDEAKAEIRRLPGHVRQQIRRAIRSLSDKPRPHNSRKLKVPEEMVLEARRLRLDRWRVIYVVDEEWSEIGVLAVSESALRMTMTTCPSYWQSSIRRQEDGRLGGERAHRDGTPGGGDPVPAAAGGVSGRPTVSCPSSILTVSSPRACQREALCTAIPTIVSGESFTVVNEGEEKNLRTYPRDAIAATKLLQLLTRDGILANDEVLPQKEEKARQIRLPATLDFSKMMVERPDGTQVHISEFTRKDDEE